MINRWLYLENLLHETEFVVEASGFEQQSLWEKHALENRGLDSRGRIVWQEQTRGFVVNVGQLGNRPVNLTVWGCLLNGHAVLFYDAVSQVVDWAMIENWFKQNCWPKWDNGTRRAHCDAMNFHHCLEVVRQ